ncbi:MAG: CBS domain-containing protein [Lactobacillus sp.]|jgi:CBS domain-containing protein|nr:CBS domain-containing protein [Lactobacillus sp.]MCI2033039.1 CBS domain-containing protein [Lactobacillus sp.]
MQLTARQTEILTLLKAQSPLTGEAIASHLGVAIPTIRVDLRVLTALELLTSRPKVGYSYQQPPATSVSADQYATPIQTIMLPTTEIRQNATLEEAVTKMFLADVGSLYVVDSDGALVGLISRKDLLRASFTSRDAESLVASIVMTRMPNVITVTPETTIKTASELLLRHDVDSLPVVSPDDPQRAIGKITKNRIFAYFVEAAK